MEDDFETACSEFQEAVSESPEYVEARFYLGICQYRAGEINQAEAHLRWVQQRSPSPAVARMLGIVQLAMGEAERARDTVRPLVQRDPDDAGAHALLARIEMRLGNTSQAVDHLQRAARLQPDDPQMKLQLGAGLVQTGRVSAGRVALGEATRGSIRNPVAQARCW
ncbi:MAG: tetratricopeptide repeat protein [Halofilum sp. (in: g-proteobacteria)]|nr:tetratricopeptide repeat protein [Halofilum sp. (in: g-proteobacteria)]